MPLTTEIKNKINKIRDYLYGGGYPDPLSNAEQLSYLFFFYLFEKKDNEQSQVNKNYKSIYVGDWKVKNSQNAVDGKDIISKERFKWQNWSKLTGDNLRNFVRDELFGFHQELTAVNGNDFLRQASLKIEDPVVLSQVLSYMSELELEKLDSDSKGDLFEHVLKQIRTAGELGQFRTPRHIIRAMIKIINPKIGETIYDPAAGTAGFLAAAYDHIRLINSSNSGINTIEIDGQTIKRGMGDKLNDKEWKVLKNQTLFGNDVDPTMVRLAQMNLMLRGLDNIKILHRNVLTSQLENNQKISMGIPVKGFNVILANPPFSGKLDEQRIHDDVKVGNSRATELLFVQYMINSLEEGGRCGVVVPEGVLFGDSNAHKTIKKELLENNTILAILSLPTGCFQPYAGVKTSIIFFQKGGESKKVLFLEVNNDGFKLDSNHDTPIEKNDLPKVIEIYNQIQNGKNEKEIKDKNLFWFASKDEIIKNNYSLNPQNYKVFEQVEEKHEDPKKIVDEITKDMEEINKNIKDIKKLL